MRCLAVLSLAACSTFFDSGSGGSGSEAQNADNTGEMCVHADDPRLDTPQVFEVDRPAHIEVRLTNHCLSSSCDVDRSMSCSVNGLAVSSFARWTDLTESMQGCTDDCGTLSAICQTDALAEGTHVITFGGRSVTVEVPSQTPGPLCLDVN